MRIAIGWLGVVGMATAVMAAPAAAAPSGHRDGASVRPAIGTMDVQRMQDEYQQAADLQDQYQADQEKFQADLAEGQAKIQGLQAEIASDDVAAQAATSDIKVHDRCSKARDAAQDRLDQVQAEYAEKLRKRKEESDALATELNVTLIGNAKRVVANVARRDHLEAVVDSRIGLLGLPDVTDEVLDILNATASSTPSARNARHARKATAPGS